MNRKVIASIAVLPILFGAMFGATPAMAATGDDPSAAATATVAAPDPVATDAVSTAQDPTPAPTDASTAEPTPTPTVAPVDQAPSTPAPERPEVVPAPIPTPEPVAAAPPSAPVKAPVKKATVAPRAAAAVAHVAPGENGYTDCWVTYPNLPDLDPYDARTWPDGANCNPTVDQRWAWTMTTIATNVATKATARSVTTKDGVVSPINLSLEPGQSIHVAYDIAVTMPKIDTHSIISDDGSVLDHSGNQINFRSTPTLNGGINENPRAYGASTNGMCDDITKLDVSGQTINYSCSLDISIDGAFKFQDWNKIKGLDMNAQPWATPDFQTVYPAFGGAGPWLGTDPISSHVAIHMDPASVWLPTAQDKTFRVKAADTLTVTPSGLLTGAEWTQGNVSDLNTYITNVPTGGTVQPNGDLEFTSKQVGNYDFKYRLEDPSTGLTSRDATGDIEVYDDAAIASPVGIPYVGEAHVGVPFTVTTADLIKGATWSSGDVSTLVRGNLSFSMQPATVNAQGGFDWTPESIGTYGFYYTLRDPVSGATTGELRGTITVTDPHVSVQPDPYVGTVKVGEKLSVSLEELVNKASYDGAPATGVWFDPQTFMDGAEVTYGASGDLGFTWTPKSAGTYTFAYHASGVGVVYAQTIGTITVTEADPVVTLPPVITPPAALPPVATPTAPKPALPGFTVQTGGTATAGTQSFGWLILTGALALIALTLAFIFASKRGRAWGRGAAIVGLAMVGVCVLGAAAPHNVPSAPLDMRGNAVQLEAAAPTSHETPDTTRAVDTGSGRFSAPTVGLDVPLGALTATGGVITPPGFTSAYQVRNVGVDPADAGNGTVFVVMHSLRNGGVGPGNYLIDVEHARAKITTGATVTVDGVNYSVTDAKVISKEQLAARADVWANTPGRLVVITCLQTPSNQPSTDNLVITATHKA